MKEVSTIIRINRALEKFWSDAHGWAPDEAALLLSKSMLRWQTELSECLQIWVEKPALTEGELILAWTNLGALVEGSLKFFLCVYLKDYNSGSPDDKLKSFGKELSPDEAALEKLKHFYKKKDLFGEHLPPVDKVQKNRNTIHSFKSNTIDGLRELKNAIQGYMDLLEDIQGRIPYPDERL